MENLNIRDKHFPKSKAKNIRLVVFDVDGILSPPKILISNSGEILKEFNVLDGLGMQLLKETGVELAIISGRTSVAVDIRAAELNIKYVFQGVADKLIPYNELLSMLNLQDYQVAVMGDDFPDLRILGRCGLGITVPHAKKTLQEKSDYKTENPGGNGAVREVCELIMQAQDTLEKQMDKYSQ